MIKHLFSDLDGTLLDPQGQVTAKTVQTIQKVGLPLTLVSARAPLEMAATMQALDLTEPQIAFNGGLIFQDGPQGRHYLQAAPLVEGSASEIIPALKQRFPQLSISYYDDQRWYTERIDTGIILEQKLTGQEPVVQPLTKTLRYSADKIFKIMLITSDPQLLLALKEFLRTLKNPEISWQQSGTAYVEITSAQAQKSRGIKYLLEREALKTTEVAAFGDGHNDLPMLNLVGLPIVMANALPEVQAVARRITRSNAADGVAYALTHFPEFT
ncbi:HAD family hydrolase [Lactobacillus sp. DCY120]|uniref:HAD family hydrolase n=1 Tax=Bombilactobacillus apium TaxID=2675299 RepID=A0A850R6G5_9LACO|nr:HAD family hydrolase [Bombilactobacillus apium]NVY96135.1 HAD family hydrolase [Bombilactobacillus apium]